jgi:hypothetical protein
LRQQDPTRRAAAAVFVLPIFCRRTIRQSIGTSASGSNIAIAVKNDTVALKEFLAAYFHEDWSLDDVSPEAVVDRYLRDQDSVKALEEIARAIRRLLMAAESEQALSTRLFREFGSYYDPSGSGGSVRRWLESVAQRFAEEIKRRTSEV